MLPSDIQTYFRSLFTALAAVHRAGILHRDIKPTNFLYDPRRGQGVLVDFGLAERAGTDSSYCLCLETSARRKVKLEGCFADTNPPPQGYPKNDTRPSRRANRAGTRGFRAPEVLFKCTSQSTKIDVWSAGVILLTILAQRFPFFNSADDVDAMIEMASMFGRKRMHACAVLHGACFDCTIPTVGERGFPFEKLILWSTCKESFTPGETMAIRLLERCLELDPKKRMSAKEALQHEFLQETTTFEEEGDEDDEINMVGA
jgi:cell division control protein 7